MKLIEGNTYTFKILDKVYKGIYDGIDYDNEQKILYIRYINNNNEVYLLSFDFSSDNLNITEV